MKGNVLKRKKSEFPDNFSWKYSILKTVLLISAFLALLTGFLLTLSAVRTLIYTDRTEKELQHVDRLMLNMEHFAFQMLVERFDRDVSEMFLSSQTMLISEISNFQKTGSEKEIIGYFNLIYGYLHPHMGNLNRRIRQILNYEKIPESENLSLEERSFRNRFNINSETTEMYYSYILEDAIKEIIFLFSEISEIYNYNINKTKTYLNNTREAAFQRFFIPLLLLPVSLFLFVMVSILGRYERVRIKELDARNRNIKLEELVRDRTADLEKQNEELRRTRDYLVEQEKMTALGELVAGVAHEVNTPLGIGVTAASYIKDMIAEYPGRSFDIEALKEASVMVLQNLQRASRLIQGFKKVAVDESGGIVREFDLVSYLAEDLIPSILPMIKKRGHEIKLEGLDSLILKKNPGDFAQIVSNLVINASIHGYGSVRPGLIRIELSSDGDNGRITVSDDGAGMSPEVQRHMYNPFFTTNRENGGSGLGLMLVYNLVNKKLEGRVDCRTAPGKGSDFIVVFPIKTGNPPASG